MVYIINSNPRKKTTDETAAKEFANAKGVTYQSETEDRWLAQGVDLASIETLQLRTN